MKIYKAFLTLDDAEVKLLERLCIRCQLSKYSSSTGLTTVLYGWTFDKNIMKSFKETRGDKFVFITTKIDKEHEDEMIAFHYDDPIMKDYQISFTPLIYNRNDTKTKVLPMTVLERKSINNFRVELLNERLSKCKMKYYVYSILKSRYYDALKILQFFNGVTEDYDYGLVVSEYDAFMYLFEFIL